MDHFEKINDPSVKQLKEKIKEKSDRHKKDVLESQEYKQGIKYLNDITKDFIQTLQCISFYSTTAGDIYENFLCIRMIDELIESTVGIVMLSEQGIYNPQKREIRYLIELVIKAVITDFNMMGKSLDEKLDYLYKVIPNSSIDIIDDFTLPFTKTLNTKYKAEVKDIFYKSCAYVHPSKKQFSERLKNSKLGNYIGFDTAKMLTVNNKMLFRTFDIILILIFHGFGYSMSRDILLDVFYEDSKWKFHNGRYLKEYKKLFINI